MKSSLGLALAGMILAVVSLVVGPGAHAQQTDEDEKTLEVRAAMDGGVAAFKNGQYADAAASFVIATRLAPGNALAHLYLGTAYAVQVVPNLLTPENTQIASSALAELDIVLKTHPDYLTAIKQEASIYRNIQKYDEALSMEKRAVAINPSDADAIYAIGYIDWTEAYRNAIKRLTEDGDSDDGIGNTKMLRGACEKLRAENTALVNDGIANLKRAIELKPDNADAMQYLQLMYRRHADLACGDKTALSADLKLAEEWTRKAVETHKRVAAPAQ
jgi:tetratricopeptide (TPR) repeat protein